MFLKSIKKYAKQIQHSFFNVRSTVLAPVHGASVQHLLQRHLTYDVYLL